MAVAEEIARELGTSGRSVRRAVTRGMVRAARPSPRRLVVPVSERVYLMDHWELLEGVTRALRTEHNVRLAVVFGSVARGDDRTDSDLDLAVLLADDDIYRVVGLEGRLSEKLGRQVEIARLDDAEANSRLAHDIVREARVLVDRESLWPGVQRRLKRAAREAPSGAESRDLAAALGMST